MFLKIIDYLAFREDISTNIIFNIFNAPSILKNASDDKNHNEPIFKHGIITKRMSLQYCNLTCLNQCSFDCPSISRTPTEVSILYMACAATHIVLLVGDTLNQYKQLTFSSTLFSLESSVAFFDSTLLSAL